MDTRTLPFISVRETLAAIGSLDAPAAVKACMQLILLTVAKADEILALTWEDIDLEGGMFTLDIKDGGRWTFPLSRQAVDILAGLRAETEGEGFVFRREDGEPLSILDIAPRQRSFTPDISAPSLRRLFVLQMVHAGWPERSLQAQLGSIWINDVPSAETWRAMVQAWADIEPATAA